MHDDVLVDVDGRSDHGGRGRGPPTRRAVGRPDPPRPRQLPQPCVPPRAAGAHARASGAGPSGPGASRCTPWPRSSTPDSYFELARDDLRRDARDRDHARSGEFHYLHHQPDGTPYDDPNAMGRALLAAADDAGIRIRAARHVLPRGRVRTSAGRRPGALHRRLGDAVGRAGRRLRRPSWSASPSTRCVQFPSTSCPSWSEAAAGRPLHVHLSEQVAENEAVPRGPRPYADPAARGRRCPRADDHRRARHAPHRRRHRAPRRDRDPRLLLPHHRARPRRRDRARRGGCSDAGATLTLGSDSHAVIDLFEEMRAVEMHERLASQRRGHWSAARAARCCDVRRPPLARVRRRRPDRAGPARRPRHRRPRHDPHRGHRRDAGDARVRRHRRRRPWSCGQVVTGQPSSARSDG